MKITNNILQSTNDTHCSSWLLIFKVIGEHCDAISIRITDAGQMLAGHHRLHIYRITTDSIKAGRATSGVKFRGSPHEIR